MINIETHLPGSQIDILVMYLSSPSGYGVRLHSGALERVADARPMQSDLALEPRAITGTEYDELAALRRAQAWGTPMFQPEHPRYAAAITRLKQLEAKELGGLPVGCCRQRASHLGFGIAGIQPAEPVLRPSSKCCLSPSVDSAASVPMPPLGTSRRLGG